MQGAPRPAADAGPLDGCHTHLPYQSETPMATWQCDFEVVPSQSPTPTSDDPWLQFPPAPAWEEWITAVLDPGPTWHRDLRGWGPQDGNRIEAWLDAGRLASLRTRLDLRDPDLQTFVLRLVSLLGRLDAVLETHYGTRLPTSLRALTEAIEGSPAFRFVKDPDAFLRRLRVAGPDDM